MAETATFDTTHLMIGPIDEVDALEMRDFLVEQQREFWGERDLSASHDPYWFRQFASSGLVARYKNEIVGYLLGIMPIEGPGYIHLVASRADFRHLGIGRQLYHEFLDRARKAGLTEVQATALQDNAGAISFHSSIGFDGELISDYAGAGEARVLFNFVLNQES